MRRLILFIVLYCAGIGAYAQHCVIANLKENIAYLGIPAPLGVAAENCRCKDLELHTDNGTLTQAAEPCNYDYFPARAGKALITVINRRTRKVIGTMLMRIRPLPAPVPLLANRNGGRIRKAELAVQIGVVAVLQGMDIDVKVRVDAYWVAVFRADQPLFFARNTGVMFSDQVKAMFGSLQAGDMLVIGGIHYKMANQEGTMPGMTFDIVD